MMMSAGLVQTLADEPFHIDDVFKLVTNVTKFGSLQYLLDGLEQPIGVREHHSVKFVPLFVVHLAALQCL